MKTATEWATEYTLPGSFGHAFLVTLFEKVIAEAKADARRAALELAANNVQELKHERGCSLAAASADDNVDVEMMCRDEVRVLQKAEDRIRALLDDAGRATREERLRAAGFEDMRKPDGSCPCCGGVEPIV